MFRPQFSIRCLLGLTAYLAVLMGILSTCISPARYRAEVWVKVSPEPYLIYPPLYSAAIWTDLSADADSPSREAKFTFEKELEDHLCSPAILDRVVRRLPELQEQERPVSWLADRIRVERMGKSEIVRISYTGPDRRDAKKIINVVAEVYMEWLLECLSNQTRPILVELEAELDRRKEEVERLRKRLRDLSAESPLDDSQARLATIGDEMLQAEEAVGLLAERVEMTKISNGSDERVQLLKNAIVPTDRINPVPYKQIAIICLVWACIPLVLVGVRRVFVRWKPRA